MAEQSDTLVIPPHRHPDEPVVVEFAASGLWPNSGNLLLQPNPQGPARRSRWHVRHLAFVSGAGPIAGKGESAQAFFYVGPANLTPALLDIGGSFRDFSQTPTPDVAFYSDWEFTLDPGDVLYALVTGGTAAHTYGIIGHAKEEPIGEFLEAYAL